MEEEKEERKRRALLLKASLRKVTEYELSFLKRGYHDKGFDFVHFDGEENSPECYKELEFYKQNEVRSCLFENIKFDNCSFHSMVIKSSLFVNCDFSSVRCSDLEIRGCFFINNGKNLLVEKSSSFPSEFNFDNPESESRKNHLSYFQYLHNIRWLTYQKQQRGQNS